MDNRNWLNYPTREQAERHAALWPDLVVVERDGRFYVVTAETARAWEQDRR